MRFVPSIRAVYMAVIAALLAAMPLFAAQAAAPAPAPAQAPLSAADQAFLAARDAARNGDRNGDRAKLAQLAPQLTSHSLAAYVEEWQAGARLRPDAAVAPKVEEFQARHPDTYLSDRLRLDWALALADRGDFSGLEREAAQLVWNTDDNQLRC